MRQHMRLALWLCLLAAARLSAQNAQPSFENDQVIINAPHPGVDVPGSTHKMHDHKLNRVMVYFHPGGEVLHYLDGHTVDLKWGANDVKWSPASGYHYSVIPPEVVILLTAFARFSVYQRLPSAPATIDSGSL